MSGDKLTPEEKKRLLNRFDQESKRLDQLSDEELAAEERLLESRIELQMSARNEEKGKDVADQPKWIKPTLVVLGLLLIGVGSYLLLRRADVLGGYKKSPDIGDKRVLDDICEFRLRTLSGDATPKGDGRLEITKQGQLFPMISCKKQGFVHFFINVDGSTKEYWNFQVPLKNMPYPLLSDKGGFVDFSQHGKPPSKVTIYVTSSKTPGTGPVPAKAGEVKLGGFEVMWSRDLHLEYPASP